jgi:very-short-patch-repair endonuclease
MWGAPQFRLQPIDVLRHKGVARRDSEVARVHEVVDLAPNQVKVLDGIPVTSPARTVCDLAGSHPHLVERVLDRFWSERLLDGRTFRRTVEELKDRGRQGSTLFRELDAARGPGYVPPASSLERRFIEVCQWPMRRQVDSGGEEWCGRVDFRDERLPLVVEIQSERYHASLVDKATDTVRKAALQAAGFEVVEAWDTDVWHRPQLVNERIREVRLRLQRRAA